MRILSHGDRDTMACRFNRRNPFRKLSRILSERQMQRTCIAAGQLTGQIYKAGFYFVISRIEGKFQSPEDDIAVTLVCLCPVDEREAFAISLIAPQCKGKITFMKRPAFECFLGFDAGLGYRMVMPCMAIEMPFRTCLDRSARHNPPGTVVLIDFIGLRCQEEAGNVHEVNMRSLVRVEENMTEDIIINSFILNWDSIQGRRCALKFLYNRNQSPFIVILVNICFKLIDTYSSFTWDIENQTLPFKLIDLPVGTDPIDDVCAINIDGRIIREAGCIDHFGAVIDRSIIVPRQHGRGHVLSVINQALNIIFHVRFGHRNLFNMNLQSRIAVINLRQ